MAALKTSGRKKTMGRPKKVIDYQEVENLAALSCTNKEIATWIKLSLPGLEYRQQNDDKFKSALEVGRARANISLRRMLWKQAEKGNATILTLLAKNMLGMRDNPAEALEQAQPQQVIFQTRPAVKEITVTSGAPKSLAETAETAEEV